MHLDILTIHHDKPAEARGDPLLVPRCVPLPRRERTEALRQRIDAEKMRQAVGGMLFGCLPQGMQMRCLNRRLAAGLRGEAEFSVPVSHAVQALRGGLSLEVDLGLLGVRLQDWVRCGTRVVHTADHFLFTADWSELLFAGEQTRTMCEARALSAARLDFRRAATYTEDLRRVQAGDFFRRNKVTIDSEALLDAYYSRFVRLFASIGEHGVLPLAQARRRAPGLAGVSAVRGWRVDRGERDIGVAVGPQGELVVLPGAKHRLAIAAVLGVRRVPVQVRMVHGDWLRAQRLEGACWAEAVLAGIDELAARMKGVSA